MYAQSPDWVNNFGKSDKYPEKLFLTGFGLSRVSNDINFSECKQSADENAKSDLIQKIRVTIRSELTSKIQETENNLSEYFSSMTQSTSTIKIHGLNLTHYLDRKNNECFALASLNREKLASTYADKASDLRKEISNNLEIAERYEDVEDRTKALKKYFACFSLFRQLEESQSIIVAARSRIVSAFDELDREINSDILSIAKVNTRVHKLIQKSIESPDDLAWFLVYTMNQQLNKQKKRLLVIPFSYHDTKMGSPFSRYFKELLDSKVIEITNWNVVQQATNVTPKYRDVSREFAIASGAALVLTGTYWERANSVKFLATLRRVSDSKIMASAEALISFKALKTAKLDIKPQNFTDALSDQKIFNKDEVIGGGLNLEVWTNKGIDNVLYIEGEHMKAYVRVNMPSYIRFIYHLADGERTLLLDNYYIDESKVNMVYQIPEEFVCAAPFGAEFLQAFARTQPFESLQTTEVDGYEFIDEDLNEFIPRMRGFKKLNKEVQQTESMIVITTIE